MFEPIYNGGIPYVGLDDVAGARKAVDLLIAEGHPTIAFIGNSRTRLAFARRRSGYEAALISAGIMSNAGMVLDGEGTIESGRVAVEQLFMRDTLPTAFMCVNDQTAMGVMLALSARGYGIPGEFSVVGFDDISQSGFMSPSLATMRQPRTAIGRLAMTMLLESLNGSAPVLAENLLMPELVIRNSVGKPK